MKDLLVGNTSQLAYFWPKENTEIVSSRNIDIGYITSKKWNKIFLGFSDGRTQSVDSKELFDNNYIKPLELIKNIHNCCEKIIFFSTTELWNMCNGSINLQIPFLFIRTDYIKSKVEITDKLLYNDFSKVIVLFPFYFNSVIRTDRGYLFNKIFDSIINKKHIEVGNLGFYRELLHPKFVIREARKAEQHQIIGSGRVIFVRDFVKSLYQHFEMDFEEYVKENKELKHLTSKRGIYYLDSKECLYSQEELFKDTIEDLERIMNAK